MLKSVPDAWYEILKESTKAIIITKQDLRCSALDAELCGHSWTLLDHWLILGFALLLEIYPEVKCWAELWDVRVWRSLVPERGRMRNRFWRGHQLSSCSQTPLVGWITCKCRRSGRRPAQKIDSVKSYVSSNPLFFYPPPRNTKMKAFLQKFL